MEPVSPRSVPLPPPNFTVKLSSLQRFQDLVKEAFLKKERPLEELSRLEKLLDIELSSPDKIFENIVLQLEFLLSLYKELQPVDASTLSSELNFTFCECVDSVEREIKTFTKDLLSMNDYERYLHFLRVVEYILGKEEVRYPINFSEVNDSKKHLYQLYEKEHIEGKFLLLNEKIRRLSYEVSNATMLKGLKESLEATMSTKDTLSAQEKCMKEVSNNLLLLELLEFHYDFLVRLTKKLQQSITSSKVDVSSKEALSRIKAALAAIAGKYGLVKNTIQKE